MDLKKLTPASAWRFLGERREKLRQTPLRSTPMGAALVITDEDRELIALVHDRSVLNSGWNLPGVLSWQQVCRERQVKLNESPSILSAFVQVALLQAEDQTGIKRDNMSEPKWLFNSTANLKGNDLTGHVLHCVVDRVDYLRPASNDVIANWYPFTELPLYTTRLAFEAGFQLRAA